MRLATALLTVPLLAPTVVAACAGRSTGAPAISEATTAPAKPALPAADRVRLAEAFDLAGALGDDLWPGWSRVPFVVLLVTPEQEFLVRHPAPTPDFSSIGYDSLLRSDVFVRPRVHSSGLLATFPAVGGVPTVVVGQAERTGKSSTEWVLTLLHEHFHQLQLSAPDYYPRTLALGLSGGDETGMWMLNYPFPYDSVPVQAHIRALGSALAAELEPGAERRTGALASASAARAQLRAALAPDDYRYLAFQLWQEGVARYTEYEVARFAAAHHTPSPAMRALPDYVPYLEAAERLRREIVDGASEPDVGGSKRVAFYPLGAATALLLDRTAPGWRARYLEAMFCLDAHAIPPAAGSCR